MVSFLNAQDFNLFLFLVFLFGIAFTIHREESVAAEPVSDDVP